MERACWPIAEQHVGHGEGAIVGTRHANLFRRTARISSLLLTCALLLTGCTATQPRSTTFRLVAYVTHSLPLASIDFSHLTHVNFAFLKPNADGSIRPLGAIGKLDRIVAAAKPYGVKVLIAVGGWGWDDEFEALAESTDSRARFVQEIAAFIALRKLDGVDLDWEYPNLGASGEAFTALVRDLRAALPAGTLLTAAVLADASNAGGVSEEIFSLVNYLNLMAYDGPASDHSSLSMARASLDSWVARGLSRDKAILGVPFYSRPGGVSYRRLLESDAAAALGDRIVYGGVEQNYNGPATMRLKVALTKELGGGIMVWELLHDASGDDALLKVIWEAAQ